MTRIPGAHWVLATILLLMALPAEAALIPPYMLDSVAAIGLRNNASPPGQTPKFEWFTAGTGFFYGHKVQDNPDPLKRQYKVYLVTAAHVIAEFRAEAPGRALEVRINSKDPSGEAQTLDIADGAWFLHPKYTPGKPDDDVAVLQVDGKKFEELGASFIPDDTMAANVAKLKNIGTSAGDGVFVLGFPMNLAGEERNYTIVRGGTIARISELLDASASTLLLDSFVFPGNSGSPVVVRPDLAGIQGTPVNRQSFLIGVVIDYIPYTDTAFSQQTHHARITFEENSGLADVIPMDRVDEAIAAQEAHGAPAPQTTKRARDGQD